MNEDKIRQLIKILEESDIDEIEVRSWWKKIRVSKNSSNSNGAIDSSAVLAISDGTESAPAGSIPVEQQSDENHVEVKSPMVGTYYSAPAPESEPFVKVGDSVKEGDVLCIIEAMKLMNEIESEYSGVILKILVDDAKPVQYNEPLFLIDLG